MGRRNWVNGKSKLSISPRIPYIQLMIAERMVEAGKWLRFPHERLGDPQAPWSYCGVLVIKGREALLPPSREPALLWLPEDQWIWALRESSPVWTLVYSRWSHQHSQQFHCIWGYTSYGHEQGLLQENSRRYIVSVVFRLVRTYKALFEDFQRQWLIFGWFFFFFVVCRC